MAILSLVEIGCSVWYLDRIFCKPGQDVPRNFEFEGHEIMYDGKERRKTVHDMDAGAGLEKYLV